MLIWILALVLFGSLGVVGYYQGALRGLFSFIGLIVAAMLAVPLSGVFSWICGLFGAEHPVLLAFLGPFIAYVVVLLCVKAGGMATHRQVDTYFKYKAMDTMRLLYDRMNSRVGIVVGLANAFVYMILLSVVIYMIGYFTIQVRTSDNDSFMLKTMTRLVEDLRETKMDKAVAAFLPKAQLYYDGVDIVAVIFRNPLIQERLSTYPVFLLLSERSDYRNIGTSTTFQDFWQKTPTFLEYRSHDLLKPFFETAEWYRNMNTMLGNDYKDLKMYLETGKSAKYDDEIILGRWKYDGDSSYAQALKRRPNMALAQRRLVRGVLLGPVLADATIVATVDKKIYLKLPNSPGGRGSATGTWEQGKDGGYKMEVVQDGNTIEMDALVKDRQMTFTKDGFAMVFEK